MPPQREVDRTIELILGVTLIVKALNNILGKWTK